MSDRPVITMSGMNVLLAQAGNRREEISVFMMGADLAARLMGHSIENYRSDVFPFGVLWTEIVQAFGRDVLVTPFVAPGAVIGIMAAKTGDKPPLVVAGFFSSGAEAGAEKSTTE